MVPVGLINDRLEPKYTKNTLIRIYRAYSDKMVSPNPVMADFAFDAIAPSRIFLLKYWPVLLHYKSVFLHVFFFKKKKTGFISFCLHQHTDRILQAGQVRDHRLWLYILGDHNLRLKIMEIHLSDGQLVTPQSHALTHDKICP